MELLFEARAVFATWSLRICVVAAWIAFACAAGAQHKTDADRAKTEGFAVVRFASNGGGVYSMLRVDLVGDESKRPTWLEGPTIEPFDLATAGASPVVLKGWLAPGRYAIKELVTLPAAYVTGTALYLEGAFPEFTIEPGKLTDLGTLIEQPLSLLVGAVVHWDEPEAFDPFFYERIEQTKTLDPTPLRWEGPSEPSVDAVAKLKQTTASLTRPVFDADGNAYFGSNLGQVLRRSPDGTWRNLDTRTIDEVGGVLVDGSRLEVATAQGRLLTSTDGGASWSAAPTRLEGFVTSMARMPSGELLVATAGTPDLDAAVFRGADLQSLSPEPWKRLELGARMRRLPARRAMLAVAGERLIAWVHYNASFVYDAQAGTWTDTKSAPDLGELLVNDSAGLLYSAGPFKNALLSADGGRSWSKIDYTAPPLGVGFRDAMNGIAVVVPVYLKSGLPPHFVETTADGGKTWTRIGPVPMRCNTARYLPPTAEMVCVGDDLAIRTSKNGTDWIVERGGYQ